MQPSVSSPPLLEPVGVPRRRRLLLVALGTVGALALVGAAVRLAEPTYTARTATLPPTLLGEALNPSLLASVQGTLHLDFGPGQTALYGGPGGVIIVTAVTGHVAHVSGLIDQARQGEQTSLAVGARVSVDPGPLGGSGTCWTLTKGSTVLWECVFADAGSVLAVVDSSPADAVAAGVRGREIRAQVIR